MRLAKVEIEVDQTLIDEVIQRYHLHSSREAVNLALRSLITVDSEVDTDEDEDDPFGLAALDPHIVATPGESG
jgi:Arc/MetJ family transcription regulator